MYLSDLLKNIIHYDPTCNPTITGLTQDSRLVKSGDLFFAFPGTQSDGRKYLSSAIKQGASAIIAEAEEWIPEETKNIPIILVENLSQKIGVIAARFYGNPSHDMKVIGFTGTNGKTSCSHFLAAILEKHGEKCGLLGTMGYGLYGHLKHEGLTTPDAITIQKALAELKTQNAKFVSMEVSSHGLIQGRVEGIEFDIGVFTNLSRDHLDYHGSMENYARAKQLLFEKSELRHAVFNAEDIYGERWAEAFKNKLSVFLYSLNPPASHLKHIPHIYAHKIQLNKTGITASIHTPWGEGVLHNPHLLGRIYLSNLLAVLTVLCILEIPLTQALAYISEVRGVPGRMETFGGGTQPLVVVDYSHSPDSLEQALKALREHSEGEIWCVFGCGGNRDSGKRPMMGRIAEQYADKIIITDDNPRHEDPREIVQQIIEGLKNPENAVVEHDRRRAIAHAIECAKSGDIILVAGKGHETYQIIGDQKNTLSDRLEVQIVLEEKKS